MAGTAIAYAVGWPTQFFNPFTMSMQAVDTTNFLYLSTFTRSSGLLLGAAMAFLWRPWRVIEPRREKAGRVLDLAAVGAVVLLLAAFFAGHVSAGATYMWMLPMVTLASAAIVGVVVHPWALGARSVFGSKPMVEIGKRSYGLYLWTWPISRICNAFTGSWSRFLVAMAIALPVSEACYRWVETPIRKGALGRWWKARERTDWRLITACAAVERARARRVAGRVLPFGRLHVRCGRGPRERGRGLRSERHCHDDGCRHGACGSFGRTTRAADRAGHDGHDATLPRSLVVVGDSMAYSLWRNLPDGIESTFTAARRFGRRVQRVRQRHGRVQPRRLHPQLLQLRRVGRQVGRRGAAGGRRGGAGGDRRMGRLRRDGGRSVAAVRFARERRSLHGRRAAGHRRARRRRQQGGVVGDGVHAPAGREGRGRAGPARAWHGRPRGAPQRSAPSGGGGQPGHHHVRHRPARVLPASPSPSDLAYRWDGVHAYKPGAKLTFEAIAGQLLAIPVG